MRDFRDHFLLYDEQMERAHAAEITGLRPTS
jgi:hypothetical protein